MATVCPSVVASLAQDQVWNQFTSGPIMHFGEISVLITLGWPGPKGTATYLNGKLDHRSPQFGLSVHDLMGRLIVGTSPVADQSWSGVLQGLAIYDRALTAPEVLQDYDFWRSPGRSEALSQQGALALYTFEERAGTVVHNKTARGNDLYIPERYRIIYPIFLQPFWQEFRNDKGYFEDVILNIAGFVPFGLVVCAYFSTQGKSKRAIVVTIVLGALLSFSIVVPETFLPMRDSSSTDLITNTLGTAIGVAIYHLAAVPGRARRRLQAAWPVNRLIRIQRGKQCTNEKADAN